ncbi:MAG TPA: antibiotic biosynthesis monooxygenase [Thermodesulfobacteriota bacterium]|nr:antibiotic biosynthesis monooxygenase [Thermodesulfobacteriota bacterium]
MIISLLKLKPILEKRQHILSILRFVAEKVRLKRGCLGCGIYEECDEGRLILYLEQWQSKEEMNWHIQSNLYLRILNAMDLCIEKPEISFNEVSDTKQFELVEALRLNKDLE